MPTLRSSPAAATKRVATRDTAEGHTGRARRRRRLSSPPKAYSNKNDSSNSGSNSSSRGSSSSSSSSSKTRKKITTTSAKTTVSRAARRKKATTMASSSHSDSKTAPAVTTETGHDEDQEQMYHNKLEPTVVKATKKKNRRCVRPPVRVLGADGAGVQSTKTATVAAAATAATEEEESTTTNSATPSSAAAVSKFSSSATATQKNAAVGTTDSKSATTTTTTTTIPTTTNATVVANAIKIKTAKVTTTVDNAVASPGVVSDSTGTLQQPISATFQCMWCGPCKTFDTLAARAIHVKEEHLSDPGLQAACQWEGCELKGKVHRSRTWLQRHIQVHTEMRFHACPMAACGASFNTSENLTAHMQTHFTTTRSSSSSSSGGGGGGTNSRTDNTCSNGVYNRRRVRSSSNGSNSSVAADASGSSGLQADARIGKGGAVGFDGTGAAATRGTAAIFYGDGNGSSSSVCKDDFLAAADMTAGEAVLRGATSAVPPHDLFAYPPLDDNLISQLKLHLALLTDLGYDPVQAAFEVRGIVTGRRIENDTGNEAVLLSWIPEGILADRWVPSSTPVTSYVQRVHLHQLTRKAARALLRRTRQRLAEVSSLGLDYVLQCN